MSSKTKKKKDYVPLTKEQKQARLEELKNKLETGVQKLMTAESFKEYLRYMATFHDYSWRNVMLIAAQRPDASLVAGFHAWRKKGRFVRKGEKGIRILAPLAVKDKETEEYSIKGFKITTVFDVSQTDGEPIPEGLSAQKLTGESDQGKAVWTLAETYCIAHEVPLKLVGKDELGSALGMYDRKAKSIVVRDDLSADARAKTLIHEIVHHELHKDGKHITRSTAEVEAEGTAYVVATYLGIESAEDYSFAYIANWGQEPKVLKEALKVIQKTASHLIEDLVGKDDVA